MCLGGEGMGVLGLVTNVIGSVGQYQSQMQTAAYQRQIAERQAEAYRQQAEIARQNAAIENKKAEIDADAGAGDIAERKRKARQLIAAQRATMGAMGVGTDGGSPDAILRDTELDLNLDIEALRFKNRMTKYGHDINRTNYLNEAIMDDSSAANALWAGDATAKMTEYSARNTLLTGMTSSLIDYGGKFGGGGTKVKTPKPQASSWSGYRKASSWQGVKK